MFLFFYFIHLYVYILDTCRSHFNKICQIYDGKNHQSDVYMYLLTENHMIYSLFIEGYLDYMFKLQSPYFGLVVWWEHR